MNKYIDSFSHYKILIVISFLVNALGLSNDIFNGDSALYASISKNMAFSNDFIHLNAVIQSNWIDKPHFSFWIWAIFIKVFGNNNLGFKLPVLLSFITLLRYCFLFSKKYYGRESALISTLILSTSLHIIISNNDVRIDIFLITFMMIAIYHFQQFLEKNQILHFIFACIATSVAIMTKGIFVIAPIGMSILCYYYFQNQLKNIFKPIWLLAILLVVVGITPALYALKIQFETYGNNLILGQEASNYLKFFFWDSQFGRFNSNLGQLESKGDVFFYFHTLLWVFAPWTILLFKSFFIKQNPLKEYITLSCFGILFIILSFSKTQLSHHALILLPFLSIILASLLTSHDIKPSHRIVNKIQVPLLLLICVFSIYFSHILTGEIALKFILLIFTLILALIWLYFSKISNKIISFTAIIGLFLGVYLNSVAYPEILNYQAGRQAAEYLVQHNNQEKVKNLFGNIALLNFYYPKTIFNIDSIPSNYPHKDGKYILYTSDYGISELQSKHIDFKVLKELEDYRTTVLKRDFLIKERRNSVLQKFYLIEINP